MQQHSMMSLLSIAALGLACRLQAPELRFHGCRKQRRLEAQAGASVSGSRTSLYALWTHQVALNIHLEAVRIHLPVQMDRQARRAQYRPLDVDKVV